MLESTQEGENKQVAHARSQTHKNTIRQSNKSKIYSKCIIQCFCSSVTLLIYDFFFCNNHFSTVSFYGSVNITCKVLLTVHSIATDTVQHWKRKSQFSFLLFLDDSIESQRILHNMYCTYIFLFFALILAGCLARQFSMLLP